MADQTPPSYLPRENPDDGYHPQEVFLAYDCYCRVRQCHAMRYSPHPMNAPPDTPIKHMCPSRHVGVRHLQPASVRQSHSVEQRALEGPSTMASTRQFVTPRISGNVRNDLNANATLQEKEEQDALRALMHMRSSAITSESDASQSAPWADAQSAPANISPTSISDHVRLPARNQTSDWPNITSTDSRSGTLMHGAILGHSDIAILPPQKRRKRCDQHHHC